MPWKLGSLRPWTSNAPPEHLTVTMFRGSLTPMTIVGMSVIPQTCWSRCVISVTSPNDERFGSQYKAMKGNRLKDLK